MAVEIFHVVPGSPAEKHGISEKDSLLSVNGHEIADVIDYGFYTKEKKLRLLLSDSRGREYTVRLRKGEYEDLGLEFETYLMDRQRHCKNKCVFCFIDQLPKGMRESLYFKDDDSRLSFLFGNYITLTNITDREIERILEMHISPINISVHTTNPELRCRMMKNPCAGEKLAVLRRLAGHGIKMNCQLVLCPGYNDGEELEKSLHDLGELYPSIESIAAVPVGLTKYREGLEELTPFTKEGAADVLRIMEAFGDAFYQKHGVRLAYPADEFYLKAGREPREYEFYGEFAQLENGVGLWTSLKTEFLEALEQETRGEIGPREISVATGVSAAPLLERLAAETGRRFPQFRCRVYPVVNEFFGEKINVSGLVTAGDIIRQLKGKPLGGELLFPETMLRREKDLFLDDLTPEDVSKELDVPVRAVPNDGWALLDAFLGV